MRFRALPVRLQHLALVVGLLLGLLALPGAAHAYVLAQWNFDGESANTCNDNPGPSTDVMGNATANRGTNLRCPTANPRNFPQGLLDSGLAIGTPVTIMRFIPLATI